MFKNEIRCSFICINLTRAGARGFPAGFFYRQEIKNFNRELRE